jgi:hypothetical protein
VENLHHKSIKSFNLEGIIKDDASIGRLKIEYIRLLTIQMREDGFVPRLDMDPDFTIYYNSDKEYFEFTLTVYGTYLGRKKSKCVEGMDGTLAVPIHKNRSKELLQDQESQSNQK